MTLSTLIRRQRAAKRLTQAQLAELVGVRRQTVSAWEAESIPESCYLPLLTAALDISPEEMIDAIRFSQ